MKANWSFALPFCLVFLPSVAFADLADTPLLTALVTNATSQLAALGDLLHTAKQNYDEAKRLAGMAQEAKDAFGAFQHLNQSTFTDSLELGLDQAYPELSYFRHEQTRSGAWSENNGDLQSLIRVCVGEAFHQQKCADIQKAVSAKDTFTSLQRTFGAAPANSRGAYATQVVDQETAVAVAQGLSAEQRLALRRAQLQVLEDQCVKAQDATSCASAQQMATILGAEAQITAAEQAAVQNRLAAVSLAQQNGQVKRAIAEGEERRLVIKSATQAAITAPPQVKTEGFNLFSEGSN